MSTAVSLPERLAQLRDKGFAVTRISPTSYQAIDAYGDGSTDLIITHDSRTWTEEPTV